MNHWADVAPLQGVDIDDKGEVTVSIAGIILYSFHLYTCLFTNVLRIYNMIIYIYLLIYTVQTDVYFK